MLSSIHLGIVMLLSFLGPKNDNSAVKRRKNHKLSHTIAARHRSRTLSKLALHHGAARRTDRRYAGPSGDAFPPKGRRDDPANAVSYHFATQRGHLPWPVDSRSVSVHFGYYSYLPNVKGNSRCITIEVDNEAEVKAVCDGQVESVMDLGDAKAVLLRHGKYFTVYSNLPEVSVMKGDSVKEGQVLGRITDAGQLDFYVYYEQDNWFFDPEKWLKR